MTSIDVVNESLFIAALEDLVGHKRSVGVGFAGRFVQIFLGLKFFQDSIPSIYSGKFIGTELLQSLLDDLYAKQSLPPNQCVLSIFEGTFKARTGLVGPGNVYPQNTWRNNFNLQKGVGCYAPVSDLSSPTFLNEGRVNCRHLHPHIDGSLSQARCSLGRGAASYRNESHRKWLRIDPGGNGYAVTDLSNISNFIGVIAPGGRKIPLQPLVRALYFDGNQGLSVGQRTTVSIDEFMADFNLSVAEMDSYFEVGNIPHAPGRRPLPQSEVRENESTAVARELRSSVPQLYLPDSGTVVLPPAINNGWSAEQFVCSALSAEGWQAHLVSRQNLGYDIFAQKGRKKIYVEVKSSLAACSPTLTAREWNQAKYYKDEYVLAVVENYNDREANTVYWVPDPANRCSFTETQSIAYRIPRSVWGRAVVDVDRLE